MDLDEDEDEEMASDLSDAIDRARAAWDDDFERHRREENKRLLDAARRDLDDQGPPSG